jgi:hypothetical protein
MIMRSNKGIATLAQISLVMDVSYCKHNEGAPAFAQTSQVDNADWPLRLLVAPLTDMQVKLRTP